MSTLIVEMEMPENCEECRFEDAVVDLHCGLADRNVKPKGLITRPSWCPIKGVLPEEHGDLVDRDELIIELMDRGIEGVQTDDHAEFQQIVMDAKAVIAAERKDDE